MTKSISALFSALFVSVVLFATSAITSAASTYWSLDVSTPATTQQSSTFNLDYYLAYTDPTDQFTVQLIANGSNVIQTQNAGNNGKYGDSGRFTVKDIPNGTYTYKVKAFMTSNPSNSQTTATRTVTIAVPSATVVVINSGSTSSGSSTSSTSSPDSTTSGTSSASSSSAGGESNVSEDAVASAVDAITETSSDIAATGVEGEQDQGTNDTAKNIAVVLLIAGAIGGVAWLLLSRQDKEFS